MKEVLMMVLALHIAHHCAAAVHRLIYHSPPSLQMIAGKQMHMAPLHHFPHPGRLHIAIKSKGGKKPGDGNLHFVWAGRFMPLKHPEFAVRIGEEKSEATYSPAQSSPTCSLLKRVCSLYFFNNPLGEIAFHCPSRYSLSLTRSDGFPLFSLSSITAVTSNSSSR